MLQQYFVIWPTLWNKFDVCNFQDGDEPEMSDWERYAAEEYEILVAEEGAADGGQDDM